MNVRSPAMPTQRRTYDVCFESVTSPQSMTLSTHGRSKESRTKRFTGVAHMFLRLPTVTCKYYHRVQHMSRFTFHLPLDSESTTPGCRSNKRAFCRTRHEVPEKQVDLFRRVQLGITPWACCRKQVGHTNLAWANMLA